MRKPRLRPRGATSLIVVMVLFFLMMMAAAFASRSLVFEQKTSANQYRYTQAFEAGEAGIQWALTMLNGGRVTTSCTQSASAADNTFRARYLATDLATGALLPLPNLSAGCVKNGDAWSCSCPTAGNVVLAQPAGTANTPAFTVVFSAGPRPGMVRVRARACSSFGSQCVPGAAQRSDAYAEVDSLLALAGGLRAPPSAALTARGDVTFIGTDVQVTNTDEETNGITANAGRSISGTARLTSAAGSLASQSTVPSDSTLSVYDNVELLPDGMFKSFFGIDKPGYRRLVSVRRIVCGGDCGPTVQQAYDEGYRMFWIENDFIVGGDATLGSATDPLLIVTESGVQLGGTARLNGLVFSGTSWNNGGGSAQLRGAAVADGDFTMGGNTHIVYEPDVLTRLHLMTGTFARVPGSWSDTQ